MSFQLTRLSNYLQSNYKALSDTLRVLGHSDRFLLVGLLVEGPLAFADLAQKTSLSKTALANHLNQLASSDLILKYERGSYEISRNGIELMEHLGIYFRGIQDRQLADLRGAYLQRQRYPIVEEIKSTMNKLQTIPKYLPCWHSYIGAMTGILQTINPKIDTVDVAGYSGLAFLINVSEKGTHIASTTAHSHWEMIHKGTELLGYTMYGYYDDGHIFGNQQLSASDLKRLKDAQMYVKSQIDNGRAVAFWGLGLAEFGIIYGYEDEHYLVSTVRSLMQLDDDPIHYTRLESPGGLWGYHIESETTSPTEESHKQAIKQALIIAQGEIGESIVGSPEMDGWKPDKITYSSGLTAYDYWIKAFENKDVEPRGNAYNVASWHESRIYAVKFIERLYELYEERELADILLQIAKAYKQVQKKFERLEELFPFVEAKANPQHFDEAIELLKGAKEFEQKAILGLESLVSSWE